MNNPVQDQLVERFLRYATVTSQSDIAAGVVPSTAGQWELAKLLASELEHIGLTDIHIDENCILTAKLEGNVRGADKIGFCAHMDTVDVSLSADIKPQILRFNGDDLLLNAELDIWLKADEKPYLQNYLGQEILFSDGTSVLGADNKAALAITMCLVENLKADADAHYGDIYLAFVPDEEIGLLGSKLMNLSNFPVDYAYTIDGGELGEIAVNAESNFPTCAGRKVLSLSIW